MKRLLSATLLMFFLTFTCRAQVRNELNLALGAGYGINKSKSDNMPVAEAQLSYNISRFNLTYVQAFAMQSKGPIFYKVHLGYQIGTNKVFIPYIGRSYGTVETEFKKRKENDYTYGAMLNIPFRIEGLLSKYVYLDVNKSNTFLLITLGIRGGLSSKRLVL